MRNRFLWKCVTAVALAGLVGPARAQEGRRPSIFDFDRSATRPATRPAETRPTPPDQPPPAERPAEAPPPPAAPQREPAPRGGTRKAGAAQVKVDCTWGELATGSPVYANAPDKKWGRIPAALSGRTVSLFPMGSKTTTFAVDAPGEVTVACVLRARKPGEGILTRADLESRGWRWVGTAYEAGSRPDRDGLAWEVFTKNWAAGEAVTLQTDGRCAPVLIW